METSRGVSSINALDDSRDPVLDRVMANRFTLLLGCLAGIVFGFVGLVLTGIIRFNHRPNPSIGWAILALAAIVLGATVRQLLWPVPLVEVTCRGVRLRIGGPMRRSGLFFIPWSHIRSVVLTQTVVTGAKGHRREDALGFQIADDAQIRLPNIRWNSSHAAPESPQCDVVFAASMIGGDVRQQVRMIEEHRLRAHPPP